MNQKPSITFIKNTKNKTIVKTITIDKFHKKALEKFFLHARQNTYKTKDLSDITCIHIKDYTFKSYTNFINLKNLKGKLILENCIFEDNLILSEEDEYVRYLTQRPNKHFCSIDIINPTINGYIFIDCAEDVTINLMNEASQINLDIKSIDTLTLNVNNTNTINLLRVSSAEKVIINNMKYCLDKLNEKITTNNLYLKDSILDIKENIFKNDFKVSRKLKLDNSHIKSEIVDLDIKYLVLKNSTITSYQDISISNICNIEIEDTEDESILDTSSYIETTRSMYIDNRCYDSINNVPFILDKEKIIKLTPKYRVINSSKKNSNWLLLNNEFWIDELIQGVINYVENEIVHIKNYTFPYHKNIEIKSPIKRKLILEDCYFDGIIIDVFNVDIELINPDCKNNQTIRINNANNVTIKSENELTNQINLIINNANTFTLINDKNIKGLNLISKTCYLKDCHSLMITNNLKTKDLILSNSNLFTFLLSEIYTQILTLENSIICTENDLTIKCLEKINTNNSRIKASELIIPKLPLIETNNSYIEANFVRIGELSKNIDIEINLDEFTKEKNELLQKRAYLTYLLQNLNNKANTKISNIINQEEKEVLKKIEEEKNELLTKKRILNNTKLKELQ